MIRKAALAATMWLALQCPSLAETHGFCGWGDEIWCQDVRTVAQATGAKVHYWHQWSAVAADIIRRRPAVVKLFGESCGGHAVVELAHALQARGIKVQRMVVFDGARVFCHTRSVPPNVVAARSFRQNGMPGGAALAARNVREFTFELLHKEIAHNRGIQADAIHFLRGR